MTTSFEEFKEAHANYSSIGAHNEESWKPVLDILNREGWTPNEYIDYVFREFRKPLTPGLLSSDKVVEMYREERASRRALNARRAERAMEQVQNRLKNNISIADILSDRELRDNALLMFLVASVDKNEEAMDSFRDAAIYEIDTMPELVELYSAKFDRRLFPC